MITLNEYIKESLLGGFDEIEASVDSKKEIKEFIKANYNIDGKLQISKEPNKNGKYEVSCRSVEVVNKNITSLTNNLFEWGEIRGSFICSRCVKLTSLKGAPKKVGKAFYCTLCDSLISLEGSPKEIGKSFICIWCTSLTTLEGAPKEVGGDFDCSYCNSLISLEGAPKEVHGNFYCYSCLSLTSLKGTPEEIGGSFSCSECISLTSLKGSPKKVGGDFICYKCKVRFEELDIIKICDVKNKILTQ